MPMSPDLKRRQLLQAASALAAGACLPAARAASDWRAPRPIKLVAPFTAGGTSDVLARLITQQIGTALGQPIVVENKPGASGAIGSQLVSAAAPDGTHLVLATTDSHCIYPQIYAKPLFDPLQQVPVAPVGIIQFAMLARPDLPIQNLADLVQLARRQELTYASWGVGSAAHVATLSFMRSTGIQNMLHVPFPGTAPAMQAVMAGQVDIVIGPVPLVMANRSRLKLVAAMTPQRVQVLPDLPTFAEAGVPLTNAREFWIGIFAPPKTPPQVVDALAREFNQATAQPELRRRMAELGVVHQAFASPADYATYFRRDASGWAQFLRDEKIRAD